MKNWTMERDRMAAMLSRLGGRGYSVAEDSATNRTEPVAVGPDFDFDFEADKP